MKKTHKTKEFIGTVTRVHSAKTVMVAVHSTRRHPLYKKTMRRTTTFAVHTTSTGIRVGDTVRIAEVRPISKTKHFLLVDKL